MKTFPHKCFYLKKKKEEVNIANEKPAVLSPILALGNCVVLVHHLFWSYRHSSVLFSQEKFLKHDHH